MEQVFGLRSKGCDCSSVQSLVHKYSEGVGSQRNVLICVTEAEGCDVVSIVSDTNMSMKELHHLYYMAKSSDIPHCFTVSLISIDLILGILPSYLRL